MTTSTATSPLDAAIETINAFAAEKPEGFEFEAAKARALICGYAARWQQDGWFAVPGSLEETFTLPIVNPDTQRTSRTFIQAGKRDGLCVNDIVPAYKGHTFLLEHKSSGEKIDDPAAPYWQRLDIDAQVSGYALACWQDGKKVAGTLYDVIRKPSIAPTQIPELDADGIKVVLDQSGNRVKNKNGTWKQTADTQLGYVLQTRDETPNEFEQRLKADTLNRPEFYFQRKVIWRLDRELLEHAYELWETADEIRQARASNRHYRNSGACLSYGRVCEYLPICSGRDTPESDRWTKKERLHNELPTLNGDGKDVLTHSRIQTFKACRRRHFYRYELGIERLDKEESQALVFGTLLHAALEQLWRR